MASGREVAASLAEAALDEYRKTGILPPALVRGAQASAWRDGRTPSEDEVAAEVRRYCEWTVKKGRDAANKGKPLPSKDEKLEEAVDYVTAVPSTLDPNKWTQMLVQVQQASKEGRLTRSQTSRMDTLNRQYAALN